MPSFAATRLINPPGSEPRLTEDQVWRGLEKKAREPGRFIKAVKECRVVKDGQGKITRVVRFVEGPEKREEIQLFAPTIIYFDMYPSTSSSPSSGAAEEPIARIANALSYGPPPANDLLLTFTFSMLPHVSDEQAANMSREELNKIVGDGVEMAIEVIRDMVREGEL
ncbi:hypothetical protein JCM10213_008332 [Rhodosporidiobolus nylandii]